jgi:hypothetical protein
MAEANFALFSASYDAPTAESLFEEATGHAALTGSPYVKAFITLTHGQVAGQIGDLDGALHWLEDAHAQYVELGDERFALIALSDVGHALRNAGRLAEAEAVYRETITRWERAGNRGAIAHQLESFAFVANGRSEWERSATLLGAAEALRQAVGAHMIPYEREEYERETALLRAGADPTVIDAAWARGRKLDTAAGIAYALAG